MVKKDSSSKLQRSKKKVRTVRTVRTVRKAKEVTKATRVNNKRITQPKNQVDKHNKPQNHNALIATSANDTLDNIRVSLDMIREIVCSDNDGMALSDDTKQGLFLHIENLMKALSFLRTL